MLTVNIDGKEPFSLLKIPMLCTKALRAVSFFFAVGGQFRDSV